MLTPGGKHIEGAEKRIRVNAATGPAHVATEMTRRNIAAGNFDAKLRSRGASPASSLVEPATRG